MLRKKEPKVIFTFRTTADAMETERLCRDQGAAGRLIPVPRAISAGCGMAWCAPVEERGSLEALFAGNGIEWEEAAEMMF